MTHLDRAKLVELTTSLYYFQALQEEGAHIATQMRDLVGTVHEFFLHFDELEFIGDLVVVVRLDGGDERLGTAPEQRYASTESIRAILPADTDLLVQILPSGELVVSRETVAHDPDPDHLKYVLPSSGREFIATPAKAYDTDPPDGCRSQFSVESFVELDDALRNYDLTQARRSSCAILATAWFDPNRWLFKNKPESTMRDSLVAFLRTRLRDSVVMPEQNVNATNPVDIRVTWASSNQMALIEIKWLGDSANAAGTATTMPYRPARAVAGYEQLLDYLDEQDLSTPHQVSRAYLVVYDGRRAGVALAAGVVTCTDPWRYQQSEIDYSGVSRRHVRLGVPTRFYLEPAA